MLRFQLPLIVEALARTETRSALNGLESWVCLITSCCCIILCSCFLPFLRAFRGDPVDFQQRQPQVAYFRQHPVERGLIGEWAGEQRLSLLVIGDGESIKPAFPLRAQMPLDANLILFLNHHASTFFFLTIA